MLQIKSFNDIGGIDEGWLKAKHHFAIGPFGNSGHRPIGNLLVFNDDEISPHTGFGLHDHANLEIVSYVREGTITHEDDLGNVGKTAAGSVQVMSAGSGIHHSERNEEDHPVRLFQIWLKPSSAGGTPRWGNNLFPKEDREGVFVVLASGRNATGALPIRADAEVIGAMLRAGTQATYSFYNGDAGYLVPARGEVQVNGVLVRAREGLVIEDEDTLIVKAREDSEIVLISTAQSASINFKS